MLRVASEFMVVDDCMAERKWVGFARVCLELDHSRSLKLRVLIKGSKGSFWQRFVFENLGNVCF